MTPAELQREREYVFNERLAILGCFNRPPTQTEHDLAMADVERMELEMWEQQNERKME